MKKFFEEFKQFALRGNVLDLAIGVIIGAAFQGIVKSLVDNIINPLIGLFAKTNFDSLSIKIWDASINYGAFITAVLNFLIMALVIFMLVKGLNKLTSVTHHNKEEAPAEPTTKICPYCLSEIPIAATRCAHCTSELAEETETIEV